MILSGLSRDCLHQSPVPAPVLSDLPISSCSMGRRFLMSGSTSSNLALDTSVAILGGTFSHSLIVSKASSSFRTQAAFRPEPWPYLYAKSSSMLINSCLFIPDKYNIRIYSRIHLLLTFRLFNIHDNEHISNFKVPIFLPRGSPIDPVFWHNNP